MIFSIVYCPTRFLLYRQQLLGSLFTSTTVSITLLYYPNTAFCLFSSIDRSLDLEKEKKEKEAVIIRAVYEETVRELSTKNRSATNRFSYLSEVFYLLEDSLHKYHSLNGMDKKVFLEDLQLDIETKAMTFDEKTIFSKFNTILRDLTDGFTTSLRDTLKVHFRNSSVWLNRIDLLDQYTIEILIIYVMGLLFNNHSEGVPVVKVSVLIEKMSKLIFDYMLDKQRRIHMGEAFSENIDLKKYHDLFKHSNILGDDDFIWLKDTFQKIISQESNKDIIKTADVKSLLIMIDNYFKMPQYTGSERRELSTRKVFKFRFRSKKELYKDEIIEKFLSVNRKLVTFLKYVEPACEESKFEETEVGRRKPKIGEVLRYDIGAKLVGILLEKNIINIYKDSDLGICDNNFVEQKDGKYFLKHNSYAVCCVEAHLLPMSLNLPMVCKPKDWVFDSKKELKTASGGYLSQPHDTVYRYSLLTSKNLELFKLKLNHRDDRSLKAISHLQGQAFRINGYVLGFILEHRKYFVKKGLLIDERFGQLKAHEFVDSFRKKLVKCEISLENNFDYGKLMYETLQNIQRANSECMAFSLAQAFFHYDIYFPAFLDFRGRVYRTGIINFHERDLYKCLLEFGSHLSFDLYSEENRVILGNAIDCLKVAAAFKYSSFSSKRAAIEWYDNARKVIKVSDFVDILALAKDPFQLLAKFLRLEVIKRDYELEPVSMDASSSAYQIMSYMLMDRKMAVETNLISNEEGKIYDMYSLIKERLCNYLSIKSPDIFQTIKDGLTRKLIKSLFMPMTYGKTLISMSEDILESLGMYISKRESLNLARSCYEFWSEEFPGMYNLLKLFSSAGGLCGAHNLPVCFVTSSTYSSQDYLRFVAHSVWIHRKMSGSKSKRHKIILNIPTSARDIMKSRRSTCANFVHQKDADIALNLVHKLYAVYPRHPIYTVHDNFITNAIMASNLPGLYVEMFSKMGMPLISVNMFINMNFIKKNYPFYMAHPWEEKYALSPSKDLTQLHKAIVNVSITEYIKTRPRDYLLKNGITLQEELPYYHWMGDPIPTEHLEFFLNNLIEPPKDRKKLIERSITEFIEIYNVYIESLCGKSHLSVNKDSYSSDIIECREILKGKWNDFGFQLRRKDLAKNCLH